MLVASTKGRSSSSKLRQTFQCADLEAAIMSNFQSSPHMFVSSGALSLALIVGWLVSEGSCWSDKSATASDIQRAEVTFPLRAQSLKSWWCKLGSSERVGLSLSPSKDAWASFRAVLCICFSAIRPSVHLPEA